MQIYNMQLQLFHSQQCNFLYLLQNHYPERTATFTAFTHKKSPPTTFTANENIISKPELLVNHIWHRAENTVRNHNNLDWDLFITKSPPFYILALRSSRLRLHKWEAAIKALPAGPTIRQLCLITNTNQKEKKGDMAPGRHQFGLRCNSMWR